MKYLTEIKLSRVFSHFNNKDIPLAILTAFRNEFTEKQNRRLTKELAGKVKRAGYGFVWVDGRWTEEGSKETTEESSILVIGNPKDGGKLKKELKGWLKLYKQDAGVFKNEGDNKVTIMEKDGKETAIGTFQPAKVAGIYTQLRGKGKRTFVFEKAIQPIGWAMRLKFQAQYTSGHITEEEYEKIAKYL